jgi:hypothetical protein
MDLSPLRTALVAAALLMLLAPAPDAQANDGTSPSTVAPSAELHAGALTGSSLRFVAKPEQAAAPVWTQAGLLYAPPSVPGALSSVEHAGAPVWDPSAGAWYASANGVLVRVEGEKRLIAVLEGVRGHDLDVRAARGVVVSREPGDTILLRRFGDAGKTRRALLVGEAFFGPRLSKSGHAVAVSESRAEGPRVRVIDTTTSRVIAVVDGSDPAWHPGGASVVVTRTRHDGERILGASLVEVELRSGAERVLSLPRDHAPTLPAVSPDGASVAYVDAHSGAVHVAPYKVEGR